MGKEQTPSRLRHRTNTTFGVRRVRPARTRVFVRTYTKRKAGTSISNIYTQIALCPRRYETGAGVFVRYVRT